MHKVGLLGQCTTPMTPCSRRKLTVAGSADEVSNLSIFLGSLEPSQLPKAS